MLDKKTWKEWLHLVETKEMLRLIEQEVLTSSLDLRHLSRDDFEKEAGRISGMLYTGNLITNLGEEN